MIDDVQQPPTEVDATAHEKEAIEPPPDPAKLDRDAMVGLMRRYRVARRAREEAEANGAAYVAQVREEVKQDLQPMKEQEERLREAMLVFVNEYNAGASFRVPGLGSAHTQKRTVTKINDQELLVAHLEEREPETLASLYDKKISDSRAKKLAQARRQEAGEILPGTETAEKETLVVKFT